MDTTAETTYLLKCSSICNQLNRYENTETRLCVRLHANSTNTIEDDVDVSETATPISW